MEAQVSAAMLADGRTSPALVYGELEQLRRLRTRITHHEPIFKRNLTDDFQEVHDLIAFQCPDHRRVGGHEPAGKGAHRCEAALTAVP